MAWHLFTIVFSITPGPHVRARIRLVACILKGVFFFLTRLTVFRILQTQNSNCPLMPWPKMIGALVHVLKIFGAALVKKKMKPMLSCNYGAAPVNKEICWMVLSTISICHNTSGSQDPATHSYDITLSSSAQTRFFGIQDKDKFLSADMSSF